MWRGLTFQFTITTMIRLEPVFQNLLRGISLSFYSKSYEVSVVWIYSVTQHQCL